MPASLLGPFGTNCSNVHKLQNNGTTVRCRSNEPRLWGVVDVSHTPVCSAEGICAHLFTAFISVSSCVSRVFFQHPPTFHCPSILKQAQCAQFS